MEPLHRFDFTFPMHEDGCRTVISTLYHYNQFCKNRLFVEQTMKQLYGNNCVTMSCDITPQSLRDLANQLEENEKKAIEISKTATVI